MCEVAYYWRLMSRYGQTSWPQLWKKQKHRGSTLVTLYGGVSDYQLVTDSIGTAELRSSLSVGHVIYHAYDLLDKEPRKLRPIRKNSLN